MVNFDIDYINSFIEELETLPTKFNRVADYLKDLNKNTIANLENEKSRLSRALREAEDDYDLALRVLDNNKAYLNHLYDKLQSLKEVLSELQSLEAEVHSKLMQAERELQKVVDNKPNTVSMPQEQQGPVLREYEQQYNAAQSVVNTVRSTLSEISRKISTQKTLIYNCEREIDKMKKRIKELEKFCLDIYEVIRKLDGYISDISKLIDSLSTLNSKIERELNDAKNNIALIENVARTARDICFNIIRSYKDAILSLNPDSHLNDRTFLCENIEAIEKINDRIFKLYNSIQEDLEQIDSCTYRLSENVKTKITLETERYVEYISNVTNENNESFITCYRYLNQTIRYIRQYLELEIN